MLLGPICGPHAASQVGMHHARNWQVDLTEPLQGGNTILLSANQSLTATGVAWLRGTWRLLEEGPLWRPKVAGHFACFENHSKSRPDWQAVIHGITEGFSRRSPGDHWTHSVSHQWQWQWQWWRPDPPVLGRAQGSNTNSWCHQGAEPLKARSFWSSGGPGQLFHQRLAAW